MNLAARVAILTMGMVTVLAGDGPDERLTVPQAVMEAGEAALIKRVGDVYYSSRLEYIRDKSYGSPGQDCDSCAHYQRKPHFYLKWALKEPGNDFVHGIVEAVLDGSGEIIAPLRGVPECANNPKRCIVSVDSLLAREIASRHGLEEGIGPWNVRFIARSDYLVWTVRNTMLGTGPRKNGRIVVIDASTGEILEDGLWSQVP